MEKQLNEFVRIKNKIKSENDKGLFYVRTIYDSDIKYINESNVGKSEITFLKHDKILPLLSHFDSFEFLTCYEQFFENKFLYEWKESWYTYFVFLHLNIEYQFVVIKRINKPLLFKVYAKENDQDLVLFYSKLKINEYEIFKPLILEIKHIFIRFFTDEPFSYIFDEVHFENDYWVKVFLELENFN
jgi:hypothetical protein